MTQDSEDRYEETSDPKNPLKYDRKEKSLGELSKKFLIMFGRVDECLISLDKVTITLGSTTLSIILY